MGQYNPNSTTVLGEETTFASFREHQLDSPLKQVAMRFQGVAVSGLSSVSVYLSNVIGNPGFALEVVDDLDPVITSTIYAPTSDDTTTGWVDQGAAAFTFADIDERYNSAEYARNTAALAATSSLTMLQRGSAAYAALTNTRIVAVRVGAAVQLGANVDNAAQVTVEALLKLGTSTVTYSGARKTVAKAFSGQTVVPLTATLSEPVFFTDLATFFFDPSTGLPWTQATINSLIAATSNYGWGLALRGKVAAGGFAVSGTWIEVLTCPENRKGFYHSVTAPRLGWTRYTLGSTASLSANTWYWITMSCPFATQAAYARVPIVRAQKVQEPLTASGTGEHRKVAEVALLAPAGVPNTLDTTPTNADGDTPAVVRRSGEMFPALLETSGPTVQTPSQAYATTANLAVNTTTLATLYGQQITSAAAVSYAGVMLPILFADPMAPPDQPLIVEVRHGVGAITGGGTLDATATISPSVAAASFARNARSLKARVTPAQHGVTILAPFDGGAFVSISTQYHVIVKSAASAARGWLIPRLDTVSNVIGSGPTVANIEGASQGGQTDGYFASGTALFRYDLPISLVGPPTAPTGTATPAVLIAGEDAVLPDLCAPDAVPPRVVLSWTATALGSSFGGYRVYRRRRRSPVGPWVLIGDITVPTGYTAATVEAQHTRFIDYEMGWGSSVSHTEIGDEGWDYSLTVVSVNGTESTIGSSIDLDNDLTAGMDAWLVSNAAPWLNCPMRVTQSRRTDPESNQVIYRVAGRDNAIIRTADRIPTTKLQLGWQQLGYLSDEVLRAQRTAAMSGRQMAFLDCDGQLDFGVLGPPSSIRDTNAKLDATAQMMITGIDSVPADYNLPAEIAFDGSNDYALTADATALNPTSSAFTYWVLARFNDTAGAYYLSKGNGTGSAGFYLLRSAAGTMQAFVRGASSNGNVTDNTSPWMDGNPHVALVTYDGATLRLYFDGTAVGTPASLVAGSVTNALGFVAGANNGGASGFAAAPTQAWGLHVGSAYTADEARKASRALLGYFGYAVPPGVTTMYDMADDRCWDGISTNLTDLSGSLRSATIAGSAATRGKPWPRRDLLRW